MRALHCSCHQGVWQSVYHRGLYRSALFQPKNEVLYGYSSILSAMQEHCAMPSGRVDFPNPEGSTQLHLISMVTGLREKVEGKH